MQWQRQQLSIPGGTLSWQSAGQGAPILFLHGGSGDAADYLKPFAEPFTEDFHCLLLDQRGSGASPLDALNAETLALAHFYEDIERVRAAIGAEQLTLIGHSWGGMLALYYAMQYPRRPHCIITIGMGPLDEEGHKVAHANLLKPLDAAQRELLAQLSVTRREAIEAQAWDAAKEAHLAIMHLRMRGLLFDPAADEPFMKAFAREYSSNPVVNRIVSQQARDVTVWGNLSVVSAPTLVLYGYQDFEPITQAYRLAAEMPRATPCFINEAGHLPWLEQPDAVHAAIRTFIRINPPERL